MPLTRPTIRPPQEGIEPIIDRIGPPPPVLPPWIPPIQRPLPGRPDINSTYTEPSRRYATVSAEGTIVPIIYGEDFVGPIISLAAAYNGFLYLRCVWCIGEIDSVQQIYLDDQPLPSNITVNHYTGTTTQVVDPLLAAVVPGYSDTCIVQVDGQQVGIAYSVFKIPATVNEFDENGIPVSGRTASFPRLIAKIRGLKVRDPRNSDIVAWTSNPSLILAHLIENTTFGLAASVDSASLIEAANYNDEVIGGAPRSSLNIVMATRQQIQQWLETFRAYARCFIVPRGSEYRLVSDKPTTSSGSIGASDIVSGSFNLQKKALQNLPNLIKVHYTSVTATPPTDEFIEAIKPAVTLGDEFRREAVIRMPGFNHRSQALRFATEKLNDSILIDLVGDFVCFDKQWKYEIGDVVSITHPIGLADKLVRILGIDPIERGKLKVTFSEYDENVYSDAIATDPPPPDAGGQNVFNVPAITGLTLTEEFYFASTRIGSQLAVAWDRVEYAYLHYYIVEIFENSVKVATIRTPDNFYKFRDIAVDSEYTVKVYALSVAFIAGIFATATITAQGYLIPPDFREGQIAAFEAGDGVSAYVLKPAIDIDLWGYEWRIRKAWQNNQFALGGPNFSSGDWSAAPGSLNTGAWTYAHRSMRWTDTAAGSPVQSSTYMTASLASLEEGKLYDMYVKIKKVKTDTTPPHSGGVYIFPEYYSDGIKANGRWHFKHAGLHVIRDVVGDNTYDLRIYAFGSSTLGFESEIDIEYIAFRDAASQNQEDSVTSGDVDWQTAEFLQRSPSTTVRLDNLQNDEYIVYAKALDSVRSALNPFGQYSLHTQTDWTAIKSDRGAFFRHLFPLAPDTASLTNFGLVPAPTEYEGSYLDFEGNQVQRVQAVSHSAISWNDVFGSELESFDGAVFSYFDNNTGAKSFKTEVVDIGSDVVATLICNLDIRALPWETGSYDPSALIITLWHKTSSGSWSSYVLPNIDSTIGVTVRYFYYEISGPAGLKQVATFNSRGLTEVRQKSRTENGSVATLGPDGSGDPQPVTVTLNDVYSAALETRGWTSTSEPISVYIDNITFGPTSTTFDVVALNLRGEPVAVTANWSWRGF